MNYQRDKERRYRFRGIAHGLLQDALGRGRDLCHESRKETLEDIRANDRQLHTLLVALNKAQSEVDFYVLSKFEDPAKRVEKLKATAKPLELPPPLDIEKQIAGFVEAIKDAMNRHPMNPSAGPTSPPKAPMKDNFGQPLKDVLLDAHYPFVREGDPWGDPGVGWDVVVWVTVDMHRFIRVFGGPDYTSNATTLKSWDFFYPFGKERFKVAWFGNDRVAVSARPGTNTSHIAVRLAEYIDARMKSE